MVVVPVGDFNCGGKMNNKFGIAVVGAILVLMMAASANAYTIKSKSISEKSAPQRYVVSASYPVVKGLKDKSVETALNARFQQWAQNHIDAFKSNLADMQPDDMMASIPGANQINISFSVKVKEDHRLGIVWDVAQNYVGSAHPSETLNPVMYDMDTGTVITLSDLFKPGSPYLKRLSRFCTERLTQSFTNSGIPLFTDGLKPTEQNFANFLIRPEGLYFVFNPYQVAPYSAGVQEVVVPYSLFQDISL